jgi:hypothetical protein
VIFKTERASPVDGSVRWVIADEIQFTVNLLVANRLQWEAARTERPHLPERPSAGTIDGERSWHTGWRTRLLTARKRTYCSTCRPQALRATSGPGVV